MGDDECEVDDEEDDDEEEAVGDMPFGDKGDRMG